MEFAMELCESAESNKSNHTEKIRFEQLSSDLENKLMKLHSFNIVHRDIKP